MDQKTDRPFSPAIAFSSGRPPPLGHTHIRCARGKTFTARVVGVNRIAQTIEWEGPCVSCGAAFRQVSPFSSTKGLTRMNCDACYVRMIEGGTLRGLMAETIRRRLVREGKMPPRPGDEETPPTPQKKLAPGTLARLEAAFAALEARVPALEARLEAGLAALEARLEATLAALEARVLALERRAVDPFAD